MENVVSDNENVARILSQHWFQDGELLHIAYKLKEGESYISVNRPAIDTYDSDVYDFVSKHQNYYFGNDYYMRAIMNVSDIRDVEVRYNGTLAMIDVDVEPRDLHTKSHAGIFTRYKYCLSK